MSIGLTLGTKQLLSKYTEPFILLKPVHTDESTMRVELNGTGYDELLNNHFNWHFTYYKFIYLKFNQDQASIFENKFVNNSYFKSTDHVLVLKDNPAENNYVIIMADDDQIVSSQLDSNLHELATAELGMFSKLYTLSN